MIDIGAGKGLVCPWAELFDIEDGDANQITRYRTSGSYDAVHSSHCLEHMTDPVVSLSQWWALIKPGGYLVLVVPDEDLYEQGFWPSRFNNDHKATFIIKTDKSWSPVSHIIPIDQTAREALAQIQVVEKKDKQPMSGLSSQDLSSNGLSA